MRVELLSDSDEEELVARCVGSVNGERAARCRVTLHQVDPRDLERVAGNPDPFALRRYLGIILDDGLKRRYDWT